MIKVILSDRKGRVKKIMEQKYRSGAPGERFTGRRSRSFMSENKQVGDSQQYGDHSQGDSVRRDVNTKQPTLIEQSRKNPVADLGFPSHKIPDNIYSVIRLYLSNLDKYGAKVGVELFGNRRLHSYFYLFNAGKAGDPLLDLRLEPLDNTQEDITKLISDEFYEKGKEITLAEQFIQSGEFRRYLITIAMDWIHSIVQDWYPVPERENDGTEGGSGPQLNQMAEDRLVMERRINEEGSKNDDQRSFSDRVSLSK